MTSQQRLVRLAVYALVALPMVMGLVYLSPPKTSNTPGGKLAQMRTEYKLGQGAMGEIDAASETIKLSTLGMRGIASMTLWWQANELKDQENWAEFENKLNQIATIMPNFVGVWRNQAWNLSYNVSVEFDDYRHKFMWVEKGINYLKKGRRYNQHSPRILSDLGWFHCHKIGEADEKKQFRRMFFNKYQRDNWLVGKDWHLEAQRMVDTSKKRTAERINTTIFHARPALAQIHYAMALQDDGIRLGPHQATSPRQRKNIIDHFVMSWKAAWQTAADDWDSGPAPLSRRQFDVSKGLTVALADLEEQLDLLQQVNIKLYNVNPSAAATMLEKVRKHLLPNELAALNLPDKDRGDRQRQLLGGAITRLRLAFELADSTAGNARAEARRLATEATLASHKVEAISQMRTLVNFDHWAARCKAETTTAALAARRFIDLARRARRRGRLLPAKALYEKGFDAFVKLFEQVPEMAEDATLGGHLLDTCVEYRRLIVRQLDAEFPKNFKMTPIIEQYDIDGLFPIDAEQVSGSAIRS